CGRGMTIAYGGLSAASGPPARKYPAPTRCSYRRPSTSAGTYWAARSAVARVSGVAVTLRVYGPTGRPPARVTAPRTHPHRCPGLAYRLCRYPTLMTNCTDKPATTG